MKCPACERLLHEAPPLDCSAAPVHRAAAIELGRYALLVATTEGELQAARAHRLPVITTCSECGWAESQSGDAWMCCHPHERADGLARVSAYNGDAPPEWCPMRGKP